MESSSNLWLKRQGTSRRERARTIQNSLQQQFPNGRVYKGHQLKSFKKQVLTTNSVITQMGKITRRKAGEASACEQRLLCSRSPLWAHILKVGKKG